MLEELRESVLVLLEERVERAIDLIHRLRQDKLTLESEIGQLRDDIRQRDGQLQDLEKRNAELTHLEPEFKALQDKREQERQEVDREKSEIRDRLEGLMGLLNSVDNKQEEQIVSQQPTISQATTETEDVLVAAVPESLPPPHNSPADETPSSEA